MDDAFAVRGLESADNLQRDSGRLQRGHRAGEGRTIDELHHQVVAADVVQRADVRMIEARDRSGLTFDGRAGHAKPLDGDDPVEPGVAGFPDVSHAAGADAAEDHVWADLASHLPVGHDSWSW